MMPLYEWERIVFDFSIPFDPNEGYISHIAANRLAAERTQIYEEGHTT
jgi:hypothetical protein